MSESFKKYAVKCQLDSLEFRVAECTRRVSWRLKKYGTPGTQGDTTHQNGRHSYVDSVVALMTIPEIKELVKLGDQKDFCTWQHPLLDPIFGRVENVDLPASPAMDGYVLATFQIVEHHEPNERPLRAINVTLGPGAKARAASAFADLATDMDGIADIPGVDGDVLSGSWDSFGDAFGGLDSTFDAVLDGTGSWQDLSRSLDSVVSAGDSLISAVRAVESTIESTADSIIRGVYAVTETARDAVDTAKSLAGDVVTFVTTAPSDLYSMMRDAGVEITSDAVASVMESAGIVDPLAILPGTTVSLPRRRPN